MSKFKNTFLVESARLQNWDYSYPWWYYVTINTKDHIEYFGKGINEKVILNDLGKIADSYWKEIPKHFKNVELDYYVIMPNHIHGIIIINESGNNICRDVACNVSTMSIISPKHNSLSTIIRSYKSAVSKKIHELGFTNFNWQARFYDRIIRNENELFNIRCYIEQNPLKWDIEKNNPENIFEL